MSTRSLEAALELLEAYADSDEEWDVHAVAVKELAALRKALQEARNDGLATAATMARNIGLGNFASVIEAAKEDA